MSNILKKFPDKNGRFGDYGGKFVSETLNPSEFIVPCPVITTRFNFYPNPFHLLFFQMS